MSMSLTIPLVLSLLGQAAAEPSGRLRAMRRIAEGVQVETVASGARRPVERLSEPIYRFDDPARQFSDGTVWGWGRSGRPTALMTVSSENKVGEGLRWLVEMTSLAPGPLAALGEGGIVWQPEAAGVVARKFPDAPAPGPSELARLRQMKELARRLKAAEFYPPTDRAAPERYELRLLPQPIYRYSDPGSGLIDGALFLFVYGTNPEIVVVLEARAGANPSPPEWTVGFARIAGAELHVMLGDREVWKQPKAISQGARDPYKVFIRPIDTVE